MYGVIRKISLDYWLELKLTACIPKSLFLRSFLLTAISLDAKKSLFSSDSMSSCSKAPKGSIPWLIRSNLPAGMTSPHRNLSLCRSAVVKLLDSSNISAIYSYSLRCCFCCRTLNHCVRKTLTQLKT